MSAELSDEQKAQKIQSLREMINSAESTIHGAKAMLLELEGKKKTGRKRKIDDDTDGHVVQGAFDGQVMNGSDGKQYPVPANYASKSKLIDGDLLKLTITPDGSFIYKQVGPAPRQNQIAIVGQDVNGNYFASVDGKTFKLLLAAITYFKVTPGDEVVIVTSQEDDSVWAAIENVLQHNAGSVAPTPASEAPDKDVSTGRDVALSTPHDVPDEWTPDINTIEQEIRAEMNLNN